MGPAGGDPPRPCGKGRMDADRTRVGGWQGGRMSSARSVTGLVFAALAFLAVAAPPAHADKCTGAKLKAIAKKESGLLACQAKVAATGDSSGLAACETKVKGKFGTAFTRAGTCAGDPTTCENDADGCETNVAAAFT